MNDSLSGSVALVTGAGQGIGLGVALALASHGADVVVTGRSAHSVDQSVESIAAAGGSAIGMTCTVGDRGSVDETIAAVAERFDRLDIVVHNAAGDLPEQRWAVEDVTPEQWASLVDVSLHGAFDCAQLAYPLLRRRGGRFIVLTSSAGASGTATLPIYAAAKAAQRGFVRSLACEWGVDAITVNGIGPLARTRGLERSFEANPEAERLLIGRIPLARIGDPQRDIGEVVAFVASSAAGYITGQTIFVDGGVFTAT
ncbi:MAG: SDR family NAD(P)-dependent oxidoreductase [Acidimicrobiia bacterium]